MRDTFQRQFTVRIAVLTFVLLMVLISPATARSAQASGCIFSLGFATLHSLIPTRVGDCLDDESHNSANGDAPQHTAAGLLVWRNADNWTAFTDGYHTWINGPQGLQERLNTERLDWESVARPANAGGGSTQEETLHNLVDTIVAGWDAVCSFRTCAGWSDTLVQAAYKAISQIATILNLAVAIPQSLSVGTDLYNLNMAIKDGGRSSPQARSAAGTLCSDTQNLLRSLVSVMPGLSLLLPVPDCPMGLHQQTSGPSGHWFVRLSNVDDHAAAYLNGASVAAADYGQDTGWVNITPALQAGDNMLHFTLRNDMRGYAYALQIRHEATVVWTSQDGNVGVVGQGANHEDFTLGIVYDRAVAIHANGTIEVTKVVR